MKSCEYFDCGWCYASDNVNNNSEWGACNNPMECNYLNSKMNQDLSKITRVEVIDDNGRSYVNQDPSNKVELSFQDNNRTLKVFVNNDKPLIPDDVLDELLGDKVSYSQCPGECYDSFYEDQDNVLDLDEIIRKWKENHSSTYLMTYSSNKDRLTQWKRFDSMNDALNDAMVKLGSGDYLIHSIVTEHPSLGQD